MATLDSEACYRALVLRDARFDGRFFVGVTTTGIFCRPVCPATTAKAANCRFFVSAAAAHEAGFRPCLRCRPETAPASGAWIGTSSTVARGLALIEAGELDGDDANVDALAERLGVGARHLRRLFDQHLGASPVAVAKTRRVLFAKQLIHETQLSMSEIAIAAGFGSVRRFNETFRELYGRPPSELRRASASRATTAKVSIRLRYRAPYDFDGLLRFFAQRAIAGIECATQGSEGETARYERTFSDEAGHGTVVVEHEEATSSLVVTIRAPSVRAIARVVRRVRRAFDVDTDTVAIGEHLARDARLARLIATRPGLRLPGGFDGFELAIRAVLGQQVTIAAARALAGKLVAIAGERVADEGALTHVFPTPAQVLAADLTALPMPNARRETLRAIAAAADADRSLFEPSATLEESLERLRAIRGVGAWTAEYIALRAMRDPDAFPATDRGIERGFERMTGHAPANGELAREADAWRPFRAYAAQHLWAHDAANDATPTEVDHGTD